VELAFLPALEQARLVRAREASSAELVEHSLRRIEQLDGSLNAFVTVAAEEALASARLIDAGGGPDGPFRGVPVPVKDLTATAGIRTTSSSRAFADFVPDFDTAVVRRLREAGFVIVGKTNTPEFGMTPFTESDLNGDTRNPWSLDRTPGGSSGGAAVAVATGMTAVAHGSDGGGSIRIPASCCGVVGLKPARGRISPAPFGSLEGLGTAGPIGRTVSDVAAVLDVLEGYEPGDPWWAPAPERPFVEHVGSDPGHLRIAVTATPPIDVPVHPDCRAALDATTELLLALGHEVVEETPPWVEPDFFHVFVEVWQVGPALYGVDDPALLTPLNRGLVESARMSSSADYARAVVQLQTVARRVVAFWQGVDVVVTPTLALPPVPVGWQSRVEGAVEQLLRGAAFTPFTAVANLTGLPAISLPLYWSSEGLPIGTQLIGPPAGEALLLRLSAQLEEARPWADRRPPEGGRIGHPGSSDTRGQAEA
jgi:amidase